MTCFLISTFKYKPILIFCKFETIYFKDFFTEEVAEYKKASQERINLRKLRRTRRSVPALPTFRLHFITARQVRLHVITPRQGRKNGAFWVKSFYWHKSVKWRLASSFAIFLGKKNGGELFWAPPPFWNAFLSLKTQKFDVKWTSENRFTFVQKNSE